MRKEIIHGHFCRIGWKLWLNNNDNAILLSHGGDNVA